MLYTQACPPTCSLARLPARALGAERRSLARSPGRSLTRSSYRSHARLLVALASATAQLLSIGGGEPCACPAAVSVPAVNNITVSRRAMQQQRAVLRIRPMSFCVAAAAFSEEVL